MISNKEVLVSVIIPVYNSESYLEETLASVLTQTYHNLEIIVIDDGSTDDSRYIISRFGAADKRVVSISQENAGVSNARNAGINLSHGDFIAFLDADDVWMPNNIEIKLLHIQSGDFGLVHSNAQIIDSESHSMDQILIGKEGNLLEDLLLWNGTCIPGPSSVVISKQVMDSIGGFDPRLSTAADMDYFIRVAKNYRIGHVNEVSWNYRIHRSNMHSDIASMQQDILLVYKKALENDLFPTKNLKRKAFGTMYRILGASWIGDGKKPFLGFGWLLRSIYAYPKGFFEIFKRGSRKII